MRLAAILFLAVIGFVGCRSSKAEEPLGTKPAYGEGEDAAAANTKAKTAPYVAAAPPEPHRTGPPPARWAMWPMPNFPDSGLPNPESYDVSVAGTVVDRVTGLMWQRAVEPGNVPFYDAIARCDRLALGGYQDWRLPSRIELVSILDLAEIQPSIDRVAFPGTPSEWFWSSSVAAEKAAAARYVYFYFGYPKADEQRSHFRVRCVRTEKPPAFTGDPDAHYEVGSTSVHDLATGLTWQRALASGTFGFEAALGYCTHLNLEGHKDWRVPSMPELVTLVDERTSNPAIDRSAFPATPADGFWTSSRFGNKPTDAWHVFFKEGNALYGLLKAPYRVRCVR